MQVDACNRMDESQKHVKEPDIKDRSYALTSTSATKPDEYACSKEKILDRLKPFCKEGAY